MLDSLAGQTSRPREVIVVDDGSTDRTAEAIARWRSSNLTIAVQVISGPSRGTGAAMNTGIRAASADIIVRLDGHCRPDARYIERSVETLSVPRAGVVGGVWQIEPGAPTLVARGIAAVLSHPLGSGGAEYRRFAGAASRSSICEVDTVPFGTFQKSVWAEVGGFDESLLRNQDYDFNHRVRLTGRSILLNPAIVSVYHARATYETLARQYFHYGFWKLVMLRKFPGSLRMRQFLPMLLLPSLTGLALWAVVSGVSIALLLLGAFVALNLAAAAHASWRVGDVRLAPFAFAALLVLQNCWSAGAWASLLRGARATPR